MSYKIQIDDEVRDATIDEIAAIEARQINVIDEIKLDAQKAAAKAALLERLGITEDEAKLLLG